jgi:hypothetical protein
VLEFDAVFFAKRVALLAVDTQGAKADSSISTGRMSWAAVNPLTRRTSVFLACSPASSCLLKKFLGAQPALVIGHAESGISDTVF